jgi:metal-dependent amidase/aminoacylase/carboxypeptidase family protein
MLGIFALAPSEAAAQQRSDLHQRVVIRLEAIEDELIAVRRDIHRHPDLSGHESRTAGVVADRLRALGLEVRTRVGGHGVVAMLVGGHPGPVVAFRADMDAVESTAPDPVEFASTVPGVRHICGHDIHTTTGLAIAEGLASIREDLRGSVMFVFQPAEEIATGARAMLADDVWGNTLPEAIYAYHTAPLNVGQIATARSTLLAGRDRLRVTITGGGERMAAAGEIRELIRSVGTIPPEEALASVATDDFALVWIGDPSPNESGGVEINATITTTPTGRDRVRQKIESGLAEFAAGDVAVEYTYEEKWIAGANNDPGIVDRANAAAAEVLGPEAVIEVQGIPPAVSEDFGSFQDEVPGAMYYLGVSNPEKGWVGMPHTPDYVADEGAILVGASAMSAILLDFLGQGDGIQE